MCGRYSLASPNPAMVRERFGLGADVSLEPRYNIAPTQDVVAVTTDREGDAAPRRPALGSRAVLVQGTGERTEDDQRARRDAAAAAAPSVTHSRHGAA